MDLTFDEIDLENARFEWSNFKEIIDNIYNQFLEFKKAVDYDALCTMNEQVNYIDTLRDIGYTVSTYYEKEDPEKSKQIDNSIEDLRTIYEGLDNIRIASSANAQDWDIVIKSLEKIVELIPSVEDLDSLADDVAMYLQEQE